MAVMITVNNIKQYVNYLQSKSFDSVGNDSSEKITWLSFCKTAYVATRAKPAITHYPNLVIM